MASIWDPPQATGADDYVAPPRKDEPSGPVAETDPMGRIMGTQDGPLLTSEGRGVRNGVPYGQAEQARVDALEDQYRFRPGAVASLAAATRKALGR